MESSFRHGRLAGSKSEFHLPLKINSEILYGSSNISTPFAQSFEADSIRLAENRYKSSEQNYESIKLSLINQIQSLKQQIALSAQMHDGEIRGLEQEHKEAVNLIQKDKESQLQSLQTQIEAYTAQIQTNNDKHTSLKESTSQAKTDFELQKAEIESTIAILNDNIRNINEKIQRCTHEEYESIHKMKTEETINHQDEVLKIKNKHAKWIEQKYSEIEGKDLLIANLEHELLNIRKKTKELEMYAKDNVVEIEDTLNVNQKSLVGHKKEIEKLRKNNKTCAMHSSILANEAAMFHEELKRVQHDNEFVRLQIQKLQALVYGKK